LQNYNSFVKNKDKGKFPSLRPYLINTETSSEENLFIPTTYNVYVLPRDLYKKGGKLDKGPLIEFLKNISQNLFGQGLNKQIYLIKDECHQATNNLDFLSAEYFKKVINFSATPKLARGQTPDVSITNEQAVSTYLIKNVEFGDSEQILQEKSKIRDINTRYVETAIDKLESIKSEYIEQIGVNPCLIIQISNKGKEEQEW